MTLESRFASAGFFPLPLPLPLTLSIGSGSGWSAVTLFHTALAPFLTVPSMMAAFSLRDRFSLSVRLRVLSLRKLNASLSLLLVLLWTDCSPPAETTEDRQGKNHEYDPKKKIRGRGREDVRGRERRRESVGGWAGHPTTMSTSPTDFP